MLSRGRKHATFILSLQRRALEVAAAFGLLLHAVAAAAAVGDAPVFSAAGSRKMHATAGTFDLPLSSALLNPSIEPRSGPNHAIVFSFDKPVVAGTAAVTEGTAMAGDPTFSGNEMVVPLTGVTDHQYVTVAVTKVVAADGGSGGRAAIRAGFLAGDVSQNRVVTLSDLQQVHVRLGQTLTAGNYLGDVDASGAITSADEALVNAQLTSALAAPPAPANAPPQVNAGTNQTVTLPAVAQLTGTAGDDGLPAVPGSLTLQWSKIAGPGTVVFGNAASAATTASFNAYGTYVLRLTADDGQLANFSDVAVSTSGAATDKMTLILTGFPAPIEVTSFSNGAQAPSTQHVAGGGAITPKFQDASFVIPEHAAAPLQFAQFSQGTPLVQAKLEVRHATTNSLLSDWKFEEVFTAAFNVQTSDGGATRIDLQFAYSKITYRVLKPDGTVASTMCFNIKSNLVC